MNNTKTLTTPERPLSDFRWIVVNSSGGKDSQTALKATVEECDRQGISRDRIVISHQDLGEMEWEDTFELVKEQAAIYGLRVEVSRYNNKDGEELSLLDYAEKRGKFPSSQQRFCTSEFKRSPGGRIITKLFREAPGDILQVMGFRAAESPARSKKPVWSVESRLTTKSRTVNTWLPIHHWSDADVWADIKASGVPYHKAYDLGMPRLSCVFCIFANKNALMIAGKHNPKLLEKYVAVEKKIGHTFQNGRSLASVQEALANGEEPSTKAESWTM